MIDEGLQYVIQAMAGGSANSRLVLRVGTAHTTLRFLGYEEEFDRMVFEVDAMPGAGRPYHGLFEEL